MSLTKSPLTNTTPVTESNLSLGSNKQLSEHQKKVIKEQGIQIQVVNSVEKDEAEVFFQLSEENSSPDTNQLRMSIPDEKDSKDFQIEEPNGALRNPL